MRRDPWVTVASWGQGSSAGREVRAGEQEREIRASDYLRDMTLLFVDIPDDPGRDSAQGAIERNSIALLISYREPAPDRPSQTAVHVITTGILIALLTGIAMKLRWFGPSP